MTDKVLNFPPRGVIRNAKGEMTGCYFGPPEQAERLKKQTQDALRAIPIAEEMAHEEGYDSLFSMPDDKRFDLMDRAIKRLDSANDDT